MRTTLRIDGALLRDAKVHAARQGKTLTAVVEEALREKLYKQPVASRPWKPKLTVVRGSGLRPGVDLDNNAALLDLMDSLDGSA